MQVDGGKWYYYCDLSGNGTSANSGALNGGVDYTTHDLLDAIFNQDINGLIGGGGNTTDTYRYATINGVHLALPTYGAAISGGGLAVPPQGIGQYQNGTAVGSVLSANNSTYNDFLAVWDAYNGTGTGLNISGVPTGWASSSFWSATPTSSGHATVEMSTGAVFNNPDSQIWYVAVQVL